MHDVEGVHKVVANPDHGLIDGVDELAEVFLLASHFDILVNLLEDW